LIEYYLRQFFGVGIPAVILFSCFFPYRRTSLAGRNLYSSPLREAGLAVFVMCLFGLLAMVLWPAYRWEEGTHNLVILNGRKELLDGVNLIPFRMISEYFHDFRTENVFFAIILFLGNMGTFLPLGFFIPLLFRGWNSFKIVCFGAAFSLSVEFIQYFLGRHCDIDDILLNALGVSMGYWLFLLVSRMFPAFVAKFRCGKTAS
jgi:glycopeptide antibiotics resistance protein